MNGKLPVGLLSAVLLMISSACKKDPPPPPADLCAGVTCADPLQACAAATGACAAISCTGEIQCDADNVQEVVRGALYCDPFLNVCQLCELDDCCVGKACPQGFTCEPDSGRCRSKVADNGYTGAPCTADADCINSGGDPLCITADIMNDPAYAPGYCSRNCPDQYCPAGAICAGFGDAYYCLDQCETVADCHDYEFCISVAQDQARVCVPVLESNCDPSQADCAPVGGACQVQDDCLPGGDCLTAWVQGYCTLWNCDPMAPRHTCPEGSDCFSQDAATTVCLALCGDNTDCRSGYTCRAPLATYGDPREFCFPAD